MESNVFGRKNLPQLGADWATYNFDLSLLPSKFAAILDFKVWAKGITAIHCFFTIPETGQKARLTAFRRSDYTYGHHWR